MGEIRTTTWRRYGHDRTYVVGDDGRQLGYRDNRTGDLVPTTPATAAALLRWAHELAPQTVVAPAPVPSRPGPNALPWVPPSALPAPRPAAETPWTAPAAAPGESPAPVQPATVVDEDLAWRIPGQAVRARADAEHEALRARRGRFSLWLGRLFGEYTPDRSWRVGADGELSIGSELSRLRRDDWAVLHSVPVGEHDSDIDHVLIGPAGVYTVNSKHLPGARVWVVPSHVRVDNHPTEYLRNARHEARRAARLLSAKVRFHVPVTPVLVFRLGGGTLTIREEPTDVLVFRATKAYEALRKRPAIISPAQVDAIFEAARWRSTWQPTVARHGE